MFHRSLFLVVIFIGAAAADTVEFGTGDDRFTLEFVTIGAPGNPPDTDNRLADPLGAVDYEYQISKFETPCEAMSVALRAGGLPLLPSDFNGGVWCTPGENPLIGSEIRVIHFVNWLNTSAGFEPPYLLNTSQNRKGVFLPWPEDSPAYNPQYPIRNAGARYFISSADEWYKAAYYDPIGEVYYDYATGSDELPVSVISGTDPGTAIICASGPGNCAAGNVPNTMVDVRAAGGLSPFGTMGQTGNGSEYEENLAYFRSGVAAIDNPIGDGRGFANWDNRHPVLLGIAGVRIVAYTIPEPSGGYLFVLGILALVSGRRARCFRQLGCDHTQEKSR